jgi:hypothetical protein
MDALLTETNLSYGRPPPLLIVADSDNAMRRALETADSSGQRVGAQLFAAMAAERLSEQTAASAIWVELDRHDGAETDRLLDDVERIAACRRVGAILSIGSGLIDSLGERVLDGPAHVIVDADMIERAAALATATAVARAPERANDVTRDPGAERLRQLSDEVSRIAATLARLSTVPEANRAELQKPVEGDVPDVSVETVRSVIRARRLRSRYFPEDMFAIRPGTCCSTFCRRKSSSFESRSQACALQQQSRRRPPCAG